MKQLIFQPLAPTLLRVGPTADRAATLLSSVGNLTYTGSLTIGDNSRLSPIKQRNITVSLGAELVPTLGLNWCLQFWAETMTINGTLNVSGTNGIDVTGPDGTNAGSGGSGGGGGAGGDALAGLPGNGTNGTDGQSTFYGGGGSSLGGTGGLGTGLTYINGYAFQSGSPGTTNYSLNITSYNQVPNYAGWDYSAYPDGPYSGFNGDGGDTWDYGTYPDGPFPTFNEIVSYSNGTPLTWEYNNSGNSAVGLGGNGFGGGGDGGEEAGGQPGGGAGGGGGLGAVVARNIIFGASSQLIATGGIGGYGGGYTGDGLAESRAGSGGAGAFEFHCVKKTGVPTVVSGTYKAVEYYSNGRFKATHTNPADVWDNT